MILIFTDYIHQLTGLQDHCLWDGECIGPVYLNQWQRDAGDRGRVHELLQVLMEELKDQVELVLCVDDIS